MRPGPRAGLAWGFLAYKKNLLYAKKPQAELRRELVTKSTSGRYDQLEPSPEEIEQELRTAFCERRQTDLRQIIE